jgi:hypothetical protein
VSAPEKERPAAGGDARALIQTLRELRSGTVHQPGYWDRFTQSMKALCRAGDAWVVQRDEAVPQGEPAAEPAAAWSVLGHAGGSEKTLPGAWSEQVESAAARARVNGFATAPGRDARGASVFHVAVRLDGPAEAFVLMDIPERERPHLNELVLRAQLVADVSGDAGRAMPMTGPANDAAGGLDTPLAADTHGAVTGRDAAPANLTQMLDLTAQVMQESHFEKAAFVLVNAIAAHLGAAQVSFGWASGGGGVHAVAVSHIDKFDRSTNHVQMVEACMEEALDQDHALLWPQPPGRADLLLGHEQLAAALNFTQLRSFALRRDAETPLAAILIGFDKASTTDAVIAQMQLTFELLLPWLQSLRERDQWWGHRFVASATPPLARALGPGRPWTKAGAIVASLALLYILFGTWNYRVDATGQLVTDSTRVISAQYEGRIDEAKASSGDLVAKGAVLSALDTRDLKQQESDVRADLKRYTAEADKARAANNLAELEIASARSQQAQAKLERILYLLEQAVGVAPFDGVVVEGERKDLQGSPVRRGEKLFRMARMEGLYLVMLVPERDIRYIPPNATGELVLVSRPDDKIPFKVTYLIPVAQTKGQEGNHFMLKAQFTGEPEAWWRPGMSGVVRIDTGQRNIAWILTHHIIDSIRMKLWW